MIDYSRWDLVDEFTLEQVAHLWCGLEPGDESQILRRVRHPDTAAIEKMLLSAIQSKRLRALSRLPTTNSNVAVWFINREDLNEIAKSEGQKPAFLFPDMRPSDEGTVRPPAHRSPFVDLILRAELHFGERIREIKSQEIHDWLYQQGPEIDPNWSKNKTEMMATFLRHPTQQKGGAKRVNVRTNK